MSANPTFRVILLSGAINAQYYFANGNEALEQLKRYKADRAILSMDGISSEIGFTTYHAEESTIDRIMMEHAKETIVVADSTKLGHESFSYVADIDKVQYWVTYRAADKKLLEEIHQRGVEVTIAP